MDITADGFYSRLVELPSLPTTSQPSVADFQEVYRRLLGEGHQIVSIHVSSKLSGTLNSAAQARESLGDAAQQIEVVDSRLAGGAQALLALSAARWAGEMADHREVARRVEQSIGRNHGFVLVDTLKYLAMGGDASAGPRPSWAGCSNSNPSSVSAMARLTLWTGPAPAGGRRHGLSR